MEFHSLAESLLEQLEHLLNESTRLLAREHDADSRTRERAAERGRELVGLWVANIGRIPGPFQSKVLDELRAELTAQSAAYAGFGMFAQIALLILRPHSTVEEVVRLLRGCFEQPQLDCHSYAHLLEFVAIVMESEDTALRTAFCPLILGPEAVIDHERPKQELSDGFCVRIFVRLLAAQDIATLQRVYPLVVASLKENLRKLKEAIEEGRSGRWAVGRLQRIFTLHLSAVYPLCLLRNSFLIMALTPNLIDLFFTHLGVRESWFFSNFPLLHLNILAVALTFCKTHDFFIHSSSWTRVHKMTIESPSAAFLGEQVAVLSHLLSVGRQLSVSTVDVCLEWLFLMVNALGQDVEVLRSRTEVIALRKAMLFVNMEGRPLTQPRIDNIVDNLRAYEVLSADCSEEERAAFLHALLQCHRFQTLDTWSQIWKRLPPDFFVRIFLQPSSLIESKRLGLTIRALEAKQSTIETFLFDESKGNDLFFDAMNKRTVDRLTAEFFEKPAFKWAEVGKKIADQIHRLLRTSNGFLHERVAEFVPGARQFKRFAGADRKDWNWLQASALLSFIDHLHRSKAKTVKDEKTPRSRPLTVEEALEWTTESLLAAFELAYKCGHFEFILHAVNTRLLAEEEKPTEEAIPLVCWAVRALVELKEADCIAGWRKWAAARFGDCFEWLREAERLAGGQFESALANLDVLCGKLERERDVCAETIFLLREAAIRQSGGDSAICRLLSPKFFSQFMPPVGAPPKFSTELLNPDVVLALSSWSSLDSAQPSGPPPDFDAAPPLHLQRNFDRVEFSLGQMQKLFSTFGMASTPDILPRMDEMERSLANLLRVDHEFALHSTAGARLFGQQLTIGVMREFVFNTNTVNFELLADSLAGDSRWPLAVRLEVGQKLANWTTRVFGPQHRNSARLCGVLAKLQRKSGNLRTAGQNLQKCPPMSGVLNQLAMINNNFCDLINLNEALKLDIQRNGGSPPVGFDSKLFAVADLTASHVDSWIQSNGAEAAMPPALVASCFHLAKWTERIPMNGDLVLSKAKQKNAHFWAQVVGELNSFRALCPGAPFNRLLSGSMLKFASSLRPLDPKLKKKLAFWSLDQTSTDLNAGVDALRLMPSEVVAVSALCGSLLPDRLDRFLLLLGQKDELNAFRSALINTPEFAEDSNCLSGVNSAAFEELWGVVKQRQKTFFELAVRSFVHVLSDGLDATPSDAVVAALHVVELLTAHPAHFSQMDGGSAWIDGTKTAVWKELLPQLFARLNHPDSFVRDTLRRLILHVATDYPHVVCWPAIVHAEAASSTFSNGDSHWSPGGDSEAADVMSLGFPAERTHKQTRKFAPSICTEIVDELRQRTPEMISCVEHFVVHLRKVVLLPAERWLHVLQQLEYEVGRRRKQVESERPQLKEILKSDEAVEAVIAKANEEIFSNALGLIEELYRTTCEEEARTVEQQRFVRHFRQTLRRAIRKAKSFDDFHKLIDRLQSAVKGQQRVKLSNVAPDLAALRSSPIPIPGGQNSRWSEGVVRVESMKSSVHVIETKTRPKKTVMRGSDGREYAFLLKGQEDLRLDHRVSNVFHFSNLLFAASKEMRGDPRLPFTARCYSVVPLGPRCGLIEWVDGPVSLYTLYRNWRTKKLNQYRVLMQERRSEKRATKFRLLRRPVDTNEAGGAEENGVPPAGSSEEEAEEDEQEFELLQRDERASQRSLIGEEEETIAFSQHSARFDLSPAPAEGEQLRVLSPPRKEEDRLATEYKRLRMSPIDLFGSLLRAKFKERNLPQEVTRNRKLWPVDLLLETFEELQQSAPKTIIADELLAKSKSSADLWARKKRFTQSTALMCALGFVVGLGDRHLENILLFENGEIVHVDLNVSFEKGAQLRVPERVPFRLSNSIRYAFGPTGIDGTFRSSAERTMAVLRSESLALTHLLKTFVHDPLLEWTSPASAFPIGNTSVGLSLMLYETDRRVQLAAHMALRIFRVYLDAFEPKMKEIRTALQSALAQICQLFSEMNAYRAAHGVQSELTHFEQRRVEAGVRLRDAIIEHQNMMRALKPALRILSAVDQRFSVHVKIYRTLISEPLVKGHRLLNESFIDYTRCIEYFQTALGNIESVYTQLLELRSIGDLNDGECADSVPTTPLLSDSISLAGSLYEAAPTASKEASSPTGVELVECVRRKLGGFQLANGELVDQPLDVVEQVDRLIAAAVDPTNLARMYEGYCSHL